MARGLAFAFLVKTFARHTILASKGIGDNPASRSRSPPMWWKAG
jgi:hypothetical protein